MSFNGVTFGYTPIHLCRHFKQMSSDTSCGKFLLMSTIILKGRVFSLLPRLRKFSEMLRRYFGLLAPTAGLEPATLCLTGTCSYHLSYIGILCGKTAQRLLLSSRDIGKGLFIPAEKQAVWCGHSSALATSPGKQNNATTLLKATESFELPTWHEVCFILLNYAAIYRSCNSYITV